MNFYARVCATKAVNETSKCPVCGAFAWVKDLQTNRELASAIEFCLSLQKVVSGADHCDGKDSICYFQSKS